MQYFTLYHGSTKLDIKVATTSTESTLRHIRKICSHRNRIFLLSENNDLFTGELIQSTICASVTISHLKSCVIDVECSDDSVYIVDQSGSVYKLVIDILQKNNEWTEIVVPNPKICPHGIKSSTEKVRISKINCNNDGILFTTVNRELYGMGNYGEVLQSDIPIPVECFSGFNILQVTTGDHFVVVLTYKKSNTNNIDDDYSEEESENSAVYLNTECSKCAPEQLLFSNDRAHERKKNNASTTETSMASSGSQSDVFELDDVWQSHNTQSVNRIEIDLIAEPSKSHKEVALNFLLESLSITSEDAGKQTKLIKDNVSNIRTMVCEGVRTLSRHMSGSDNNDGPAENDLSYDEQLDKSTKTIDISDCADSLFEESSMGIGSALDLQSLCEIENKVGKMCRIGGSILGTGVWCFGNVNKGQLGSGDHVKRTRINQVLGLTGQGVVKICSGNEHSIALTLDGKFFNF